MDNIILMPIYDCYYMINTKTSKLIDGRGLESIVHRIKEKDGIVR